jgi:hypothetical protein
MTRTYKPYVVQQGDHVERLAFHAGAPCEEVWDHPKNAELKQKRKTMDVLLPGDILHLPSGDPDGLAVSKETKNKFTATIGKRPMRVLLHDEAGPLANQPYEIRGLPMHPGAEPPKGQSGANGEVEIEVPHTVREVVLYLPELQHSVVLSVGGMDPVDERSGTLRRLENLGYIRKRGNVSDEHVESAIRAFQRDHDLERTGTDDEATCEKLREVCGG